LEKVPFGHLPQASNVPLVWGLNLPAGHGMQDVAPSAEYVPDGHKAQTLLLVAPTTVENDPPGHLMHKSREFAPNKPEYVPAGQLIQVERAFAREIGEYVPFGHFSQTVAPKIET
jgi:hypothetical protein